MDPKIYDLVAKDAPLGAGELWGLWNTKKARAMLTSPGIAEASPETLQKVEEILCTGDLGEVMPDGERLSVAPDKLLNPDDTYAALRNAPN